ncbi:acyl-ACP--UDP-N-acetylglucosamine O-acyltransferase [Aeoliella sp.]|uniref:acyl-ACP--UDP-N-acetylglucosamine O-acyltransferase n=1 Tax=Aeoliella sp. TaxID=2795800 RepID=UPI003CCB90AF
MLIHPLAEVSPSAKLGADITIGPFAVVEDDVEIGNGCQILARSSIKNGTTLGEGNIVGEGAVVGGLPQHLSQPEQPGRVVIGDRNVIRENVTIHRAFVSEAATTIGSECLLMVGSHVAHDCIIGNNVVLTNNALLGGHVIVGDRAYLGGGAAVHQHCHIGRVAMVGGLARLDQDVPPFVMVDGETNRIVGLNRVGLRRAGVTPQERSEIKDAYQLIFRTGLKFADLLDTLDEQYQEGPAAEFAPFLRAATRGYIRERRDPPKSFRLVREDPATADAVVVEPIKQAG